MDSSYSIAEARNKFAAIVHDAEQNKKPIKLTRRGKSVAVILSIDEYERLTNGTQPNWLESYQAWRKEWDMDNIEINPENIWGDVRDKTPAREDNPWD